MRDRGAAAGAALALALLACALAPGLARWRAAGEAQRRLTAAAPGAVALLDLPATLRGRAGSALASWQTVGGCGAGASSGTGGGLKWVGRNVTGGLFHVETQGNYIHTVTGYNYAATTLVTRDITPRLNIGVSVPYLYKFYGNNPYKLDFDVVNKGLGDVNALLTGRFGATNENVLSLSVGAPTGTHDAHLIRAMTEILPQDQQLGAGKVTASLMYDRIIDNIWGPTVLGGVASWRGGENDVGSYRAPSLTGYWYSGYLLGPFCPSVGLSFTRTLDHDRDRGSEQISPIYTAAAQIGLEWSTDSVAVVLGGVLPYQYDGVTQDANETPRSPWSWGAWVVGLGIAISPF